MEDIWNYVIVEYVSNTDIVRWRYLSKRMLGEYQRRLPMLANDPEVYQDVVQRFDTRCLQDLDQHPITNKKMKEPELWLDLIDVASKKANWEMVDIITSKKRTDKVSFSKPIMVGHLRLAVLNTKYRDLLPLKRSRFFNGLVVNAYIQRYPYDLWMIENYNGPLAEDLHRALGFYR